MGSLSPCARIGAHFAAFAADADEGGKIVDRLLVEARHKRGDIGGPAPSPHGALDVDQELGSDL
jgi:hypothetical protein